ncbi:glycosyltransferase family A protein [Alterisphingorhabdus coralli]|uniref:Glycosyltransferase family A protein n=1 Tax=Alterisphingorhabdus coralli TaxID=3071408 RepID=A0AA97I1B2_9SPHN|nr:glycosyltransferase family A protein [Parasphingorhabdus sp. SCSIO 66989]WOE76564.1 glycosyltransferase family A protein [Parasphingorhabdus sp. SCSIO 66989]
MFYRLKASLGLKKLNAAAKGILQTPPIPVTNDPLIFLSQLCHRDVLAYLVALKSIHRAFKQGRVIIMDDGSLTDEDKAILAEHIPEVVIRPIAEVDTHGCPRGGTWERLWAIMEMSRIAYVIQVDADLIGLGPMPETVAAYQSDRCFTLGSRMGQSIETFTTTSKHASVLNSKHVQTLSERIFKELPHADQRYYVRGCSGFAGFAQNSIKPETLITFSEQVETKIGSVWHEWGSEQISSNMLIANTTDPLILPHPAYANYDPDINPANAQLLHFVGTHRFYRGIYAQTARKVIKDLTN